MHFNSSSASAPPVIELAMIQECFADVDGCRMRYLAGGEGMPLVLIHGLLGYSFSWRFNLEVLARHARVYAIDLPGSGFSCRNPALTGDLASLAQYVLAFMQAVGAKSAGLLGSSPGGGAPLFVASLENKGVRFIRP